MIFQGMVGNIGNWSRPFVRISPGALVSFVGGITLASFLQHVCRFWLTCRISFMGRKGGCTMSTTNYYITTHENAKQTEFSALCKVSTLIYINLLVKYRYDNMNRGPGINGLIH